MGEPTFQTPSTDAVRYALVRVAEWSDAEAEIALANIVAEAAARAEPPLTVERLTAVLRETDPDEGDDISWAEFQRVFPGATRRYRLWATAILAALAATEP